MTGPNARLEYRKIVPGSQDLEPLNDPTFEYIKEKIGYDTITCHAWSSDGVFFGVCSEEGNVIVYKLGCEIVFDDNIEIMKKRRNDPNDQDGMSEQSDLSDHEQNEQREDDENIRYIGLALFEYGMVIASSDGYLTFFDSHEEGDFLPIRRWKYRCEDLHENPFDVIRGL